MFGIISKAPTGIEPDEKALVALAKKTVSS
jgi:hypothetical protein